MWSENKEKITQLFNLSYSAGTSPQLAAWRSIAWQTSHPIATAAHRQPAAASYPISQQAG